MHPVERRRRESYAPIDRRGLIEWAPGKRLPAAYAFRGAFNLSLSPWLRRQWEGLDDPLTREVTCIAGVRSAKTLGADLYCAKCSAAGEGPIMFNIGNDDDAKDHSKTRLLPLLEGIKEVASKFTGERRDKSDSLIRFIDGNFIIIQGLVNPNNFDSKGIRILINDEGHKAKPGNLSKAKSRTDDFRHNCKVLNISQGGIVNDDMDVAFRRGTMERFGWRCPECDTLQSFSWRDAKGEHRLRWDRNEVTCPGGKWDFDKMAQTLRWKCENPDCSFVVRDTPTERRRQTYELQEFLPPENPLAPRDTVSVWWPQFCVPWIPWKEVAIDWIESMAAYEMGDTTKLKNFIQRRCAESWEEGEFRLVSDTEEPPSDYATGDPWSDEQCRVMACDAQIKGGLHFVCEIRAFAADGRSRLLWAGRLESYAEIAEKREEYQLQASPVGIDSRHDIAEVENMCAQYGWLSLLGDDGTEYPHRDKNNARGMVMKRWSSPRKIMTGLGARDQASRRFCLRVMWSRPVFSDILQRRMSGKSLYYGVPGDVTACSSYDDPNHPGEGRLTSYWPQMRSWQKIKKRHKETGVEKSLWVRIGSRHDHYRSAALMCLVLAGVCGCLGGELIEAPPSEG